MPYVDTNSPLTDTSTEYYCNYHNYTTYESYDVHNRCCQVFLIQMKLLVGKNTYGPHGVGATSGMPTSDNDEHPDSTSHTHQREFIGDDMAPHRHASPDAHGHIDTQFHEANIILNLISCVLIIDEHACLKCNSHSRQYLYMTLFTLCNVHDHNFKQEYRSKHSHSHSSDNYTTVASKAESSVNILDKGNNTMPSDPFWRTYNYEVDYKLITLQRSRTSTIPMTIKMSDYNNSCVLPCYLPMIYFRTHHCQKYACLLQYAECNHNIGMGMMMNPGDLPGRVTTSWSDSDADQIVHGSHQGRRSLAEWRFHHQFITSISKVKCSCENNATADNHPDVYFYVLPMSNIKCILTYNTSTEPNVEIIAKCRVPKLNFIPEHHSINSVVAKLAQPSHVLVKEIIFTLLCTSPKALHVINIRFACPILRYTGILHVDHSHSQSYDNYYNETILSAHVNCYHYSTRRITVHTTKVCSYEGERVKCLNFRLYNFLSIMIQIQSHMLSVPTRVNHTVRMAVGLSYVPLGQRSPEKTVHHRNTTGLRSPTLLRHVIRRESVRLEKSSPKLLGSIDIYIFNVIVQFTSNTRHDVTKCILYAKKCSPNSKRNVPHPHNLWHFGPCHRDVRLIGDHWLGSRWHYVWFFNTIYVFLEMAYQGKSSRYLDRCAHIYTKIPNLVSPLTRSCHMNSAWHASLTHDELYPAMIEDSHTVCDDGNQFRKTP